MSEKDNDGEESLVSKKKKKKQKTFEWIDRDPEDCMKELSQFCMALIRNMDERYENCVTSAPHILGNFRC